MHLGSSDRGPSVLLKSYRSETGILTFFSHRNGLGLCLPRNGLDLRLPKCLKPLQC